jgi:hypothetical protein
MIWNIAMQNFSKWLLTTIVGTVWAVCWLVTQPMAQTSVLERPAIELWRADNSADPFILGRQIPASIYNPSEAVQWGFDFLIAPNSAKSRVILYAYDISKSDPGFFHELERLIFESQPKIAIVSKAASAGGSAASDFAVPIILDSQNRSFVGGFISAIADPAKSALIVPAIIAVATFKAWGFEPTGINSRPISSDQPWSGLIASSVPVGNYKYRALYIIPNVAAWDITKNPRQTMATRSEVQNLISKQDF